MFRLTCGSEELEAVCGGLRGGLHLRHLLLQLSVQRQVRVVVIVWVIMWMAVNDVTVHVHVIV